VTLSTDQIPSHDHSPVLPVSTAEGDATTPDGNTLGAQPDARGTVPVYDGSGGTDGSMAVNSDAVGGSQGHGNMPPFQTIRYCISLSGVFPQRN
jgi:microcystin-dependent protein